MPATNPLVLENLSKLREINVANLLTGMTLVVRVSGTGLPPCSYTLMDNITLPDYPPIVITPAGGGTRKWLGHNNIVIRDANPTSAPPFINLQYINTANQSIFFSVNTTATTDWFGVQGMGAGTSSNV